MASKMDGTLAFGLSATFAASASAIGVALLEHVVLADEVTTAVTYGLSALSSVYVVYISDKQYHSPKSSLGGAVSGYAAGFLGATALFAGHSTNDVSSVPSQPQATIVEQHSPSPQSTEFLAKYSIA